MLTSGVFGYVTDYALWCVLYISLLLHAWCFFKLFPLTRRPRVGLAVGNVLIFACLVGTIALGGETYFRFFCVETDSYGLSLPARRWFLLHTELNSLGCRDVEWDTTKPPGVTRIAFVGDSFAYGWGIERPSDRFPDLVGSMLAENAPRAFEVMNVSKPGWDTEAELVAVRDLIAWFAVDEVVLCYVPNDIDKLLPGEWGFDPVQPPTPALFDPDRSCLADYLYRRYYVPRLPAVRNYFSLLDAGYADESVWQRQSDRITGMIEECRRGGVTLRVVLLPMLQSVGSPSDHSRVRDRLAKLLEAHNVPLVDLHPVVAGRSISELIVNSMDAHPNEKAHSLFARAIWRAFYAGAED